MMTMMMVQGIVYIYTNVKKITPAFSSSSYESCSLVDRHQACSMRDSWYRPISCISMSDASMYSCTSGCISLPWLDEVYERKY